MVSLDYRPALPTSGPRSGKDGTRTEFLVITGSAAAVLGAAVAMAVLSAITVLLWALGPIAGDGVSAAPFRGAAALWLMGQRAPLDSGTFDLVLPPLLVSVVVVVLIARLAGWAVRTTAAFELRPAATVGAGLVLGHVVVAGIAGWVSDRAGSGVETLDAMRAAFVFAVPCVVAGIAPHTWIWAVTAARWGTHVRIGARAAGRGVLALAAGGALVLVASLVVHHRKLGDLFQVLGGGVSGIVGTTLLCVALAPNAVLWVVALSAGPGFALGTDAGVSLTGDMHGGGLPAMPLLAALPGAGPLPAYALVLLAVPLTAGGVVGWYARPAAGTRGWRADLGTAAVSGAICGLGIGLLAGLSGGGAGGRLAQVGPSGVTVALMLALELALAATAVAAGRIGWEHYRGPQTPKPPATEKPAKTSPTSSATTAAEERAKPAAAEPDESAAPGEGEGTDAPKGARRFTFPLQRNKQAAGAGTASGSPAEATPIVVVAASEVDDLPTADLPGQRTGDDGPVGDIEDTQELPVLSSDVRPDVEGE